MSKRAIIIGCDFYYDVENARRAIGRDKNLHGAVLDAENMRDCLADDPYNVEDITLLTSPHPSPSISEFEANILDENNKTIPTYENIMNALKNVLDQAQKGDYFFFHYSGHGARVPSPTILKDSHGLSVSKWPGIKTLDEVLVPVDIALDKGPHRGQYIRDWELAYVFDTLSRRGVKLSVVIDCCHSGSSTRTAVIAEQRSSDDDAPRKSVPVKDIFPPQARVVNVPTSDQDHPVDKQIIFPIDDIKAAWIRVQAEHNQVIQGKPTSPRYNILMACLATEFAYEIHVPPNDERRGLLSWGLTEALRQSKGQRITYQMVQRLIYDHVYGRSYSGAIDDRVQTPMAMGRMDEVVFGDIEEGTIPHAPCIALHAVVGIEKELVDNGEQRWHKQIVHERSEPKIVLRAGKMHGIHMGEIYDVYEWTATAEDMRNRTGVVGQLRVQKVDEVVSVMDFVSGDKILPWNKGRQAVLVSGAPRHTKRISIAKDVTVPALADLAPNDTKFAHGTVHFAFRREWPPSTPPHFHLDVDANRKVWICDLTGKRYPNVPGGDSDDLGNTILRLQQLAQYLERRDIKKTGESSTFECSGPTKESPDAETETFNFHFDNTYSEPVNISVYHFTPTWGVSKVYPALLPFETVDPYRTRDFQLTRKIPTNVPSGTDVVKMIIMDGSSLFETWEAEGFGDGDDLGAAEKLVGLSAEKRLGLSAEKRLGLSAEPPGKGMEWLDEGKEVETSLSLGANEDYDVQEKLLNKWWTIDLTLTAVKKT